MPQVFDAPIPGQSLTKPQGSYKFEKPPQFLEEETALEWVWGKLLSQDSIPRIKVLLKNDISVVEMAQTLLYAGAMEGKWTIDLAYLMMQEVTWMIEAIAKRSGVKEYTYKKPKETYKNFISEYAEYLSEPDEEQEKATKVVQETVFTGIM
jgi:hypothetical protein